MIRAVRAILSLVFLVGMLWAAFTVDLGGRTFAEHVDTISDTPEAEELIEGTRAKINPALQEVRDRVLGEYVEAPTWISEQRPSPPENERSVPASTLAPRVRGGSSRPSTARLEPPLPGRGEPSPGAAEPPLPGRGEPSPGAAEPPLPGRGEPSPGATEPSPGGEGEGAPAAEAPLAPPLPGRREQSAPPELDLPWGR